MSLKLSEKKLTKIGNSLGFIIAKTYFEDKVLDKNKTYTITIEEAESIKSSTDKPLDNAPVIEYSRLSFLEENYPQDNLFYS